jgi:hypothetical protein
VNRPESHEPANSVTRRQAVVERKIAILGDRRAHQDNLVHARLGWLIATEAFLLIGFITASDKETLSRELPWIAVVGLMSTLLVYVSILSGIRTYMIVRDKLERILKSTAGKRYSDIRIKRNAKSIQYIGFCAPLLVPWVFLCLWSFLLVNRCVLGWILVGLLVVAFLFSIICALAYKSCFRDCRIIREVGGFIREPGRGDADYGTGSGGSGGSSRGRGDGAGA